jgi:hypothetical protein
MSPQAHIIIVVTFHLEVFRVSIHSEIAMQRIASNHTYAWLRVRAKCEMGWETMI